MRRIRAALAAAVTAALVVPAVATAESPTAPATQQVSHRGYQVTVPADWRVVDLAADPAACIIFRSPTVYVGPAGTQEDCPAHAVGGAPGLWIRDAGTTPTPVGARTVDEGAHAATASGDGGEAHLVIRDAGVVVSSFGGAKAADVLKTASLTADARRAAPAPTAQSAADADGGPGTLAAVKVPGKFRGRGFDACAAPGAKVMKAWRKHSAYRSVGIYIGGISRACAQPNLTASWVRNRVKGGWHLLPIHVGPQAPCEADRFAHTMSSKAATARKQGRKAARGAVSRARSLAIGKGSVLYYDIEGYDNTNGTCRRAVLSFLSGWTNELRRKGYRSGVYSSISSGIADLSDTYRSKKYARPHHIWPAWWNGKRNVDFKPYVPDGQWSGRQRVHQYRGDHDETHGGHRLNIDSNFMRVR